MVGEGEPLSNNPTKSDELSRSVVPVGVEVEIVTTPAMAELSIMQQQNEIAATQEKANRLVEFDSVQSIGALSLSKY